MTIYLLEIAGYALAAFGVGVTIEHLSEHYKRRKQMRISFPQQEAETKHDHEEDHHAAMVG